MGILWDLLWTVVVVFLLQIPILVIANALTKTNAIARVAIWTVLGAGAAYVLIRVAGVESPVIPILGAVAMWIMIRESDKLISTPEFREQNGVLISSLSMKFARVGLVGTFAVLAILLTMELCSGDTCKPLI